MLDYYLGPENVHRLSEALCDLYCGYSERSVCELRADGFWTSDDLGLFFQPKTVRQKQLFVRLELFLEFIWRMRVRRKDEH